MTEEKIVFEDEFNIYGILKNLWKNKILVVIIVSVFAVTSIIYSLVVDHEYEVITTIQPADASDETSIKGSSPVMGFALTGYSHLPVINSIMITLKSASFLEIIYEKYKDDERVYGTLMKEIDESDDPQEFKDQLKRYDGVKKLQKTIRTAVNSDHNTILISVKLQDKYKAYELMNYLLDLLRDTIRKQNIDILESDIKFYQELMDKATDPRIQQILDRKLTSKLEKKFILSSNLFTIVDKPVIPAKRVFPKRSMIVILTTFAGGLFAVMLITVKPVALKVYKVLKDTE
jgi:capsular polysaccharide biosynthesis protein